jgi:hypothetical protein
MPENQGSYGSMRGSQHWHKHGEIQSPQGPCGYDAQPNGGPSLKGGDPTGRWAEHKETPNLMMGVARDGLKSSPDATGEIVTPMSTAKSEMPGLTGSSGTGPTGEGRISTPWGHGTAGWEGSSTNASGKGSQPTSSPGMGSNEGAGAKPTY